MLEYDPLLLSLGPYHHKMNERFEDMDKTKELYFQSLCARRCSSSIEKTCLAEMAKMEEAARATYANSYKSLNSDEFIRMMILDGCFIIELLRIYETYPDLREEYFNDPILRIEFLTRHLFRDMLLFENQLPLFVLEMLFELTKGPEDGTRNFVDLALCVLPLMIGKGFDQNSHHLKGSPHYLLGLAYIAYLLPFPAQVTQLSTNDNCDYEHIRSATALREAGVKFMLNEAPNDDGFGIIFKDNGVLEIPRLIIEDYTESLMRNFIACEQYCLKGKLHRVTDYFIFMDCLINTSKDVELLRHERIIENSLGDDEKVSQMFNQITSSVTYDKETFYYTEQSKKVDEYCGKSWNVWRAKLRHDYFNSPWALLSFLAALALLLLTSIQTIFSVLSYFHPKS